MKCRAGERLSFYNGIIRSVGIEEVLRALTPPRVYSTTKPILKQYKMKQRSVIFAQPLTLNRDIAYEAARTAFETPEIAELNLSGGFQELQSHPVPSLLVADLKTAADACAVRSPESQSLPPWAVVGLGHGSLAMADVIPPEEWNAPLLARVFRHAVCQHELRTANLRFSGDLKTIARRISHDLRSPLGCVQTNLEMLMGFPIIDMGTLRKTASVIQESIIEAMEILNRVCFVLAATAEAPNFAPVDAGLIATKAIDGLQDMITECHADLSLPTTWPKVRVVTPWLYVIWTNLLRNSLENAGYSPKIHINWETLNQRIQFSVTDNGPGVSTDRISEIFVPFEQLYKIRTRGLGLSIVQRLVNLQGGECGHDYLPGGGSAFRFTLPSPDLIA